MEYMSLEYVYLSYRINNNAGRQNTDELEKYITIVYKL